ncbi:hypothetical protein CR513_32912, partial [Mucuna pruriens]
MSKDVVLLSWALKALAYSDYGDPFRTTRGPPILRKVAVPRGKVEVHRKGKEVQGQIRSWKDLAEAS